MRLLEPIRLDRKATRCIHLVNIRALFAIAVIVVTWQVPLVGAAAENNAAGLELFEKKIRPVLVKYCYECHSADSEEAKGGFLLDTREGIRQGGDSGHAVVPNDVKSSLLIDAMPFDTFEMPPDNQLPDGVIADFLHWIKMGASDLRDGSAALAHNEPEELWSLRPLYETSTPAVSDADWSRSEIDHFVLARLEQQGLEPVEDADRPLGLARF